MTRRIAIAPIVNGRIATPVSLLPMRTHHPAVSRHLARPGRSSPYFDHSSVSRSRPQVAEGALQRADPGLTSEDEQRLTSDGRAVAGDLAAPPLATWEARVLIAASRCDALDAVDAPRA